MIIQNLAASFPSRKLNNQEVLDLIRHHSREFEGDIGKMLRVAGTLLERSGAVTRQWCEKNEKPIDHLDAAVSAALAGSQLRPQDVDLLVYVGVWGGFREPANSFMVAKALGMRHAQCFDVTEACMSWTRAMFLVDSLFKSGSYRNALIVNAEFNMMEGGAVYPVNFALANAQQLEYLLPSFTLGEAATATLLLPDSPGNFSFGFHARPEFADLCTSPVFGYEGLCRSDSDTARLRVGQFSSWGGELHAHLDKELPKLLARSQVVDNDVDIVFTHSSSSAEWHKIGVKLGLAQKVYHIYPQLGNVVSASLPAAMACAQADGQLRKGNRVLFLMGSAGMSFAISKFVF